MSHYVFRVFQDHYEQGLLVREVQVPANEVDSLSDVGAILDRAFYWGQNDFQPQPDRISVSVGHIIELPQPIYERLREAGQRLRHRSYMVMAPTGFQELDAVGYGLRLSR